jgi:phosphatidylserine decarboxylase
MPKHDPYVGLLEIFVDEAQNLPVMDLTGRSGHRADPYILIRFGTTEERKTQTIKGSQNPKFSEAFKILVTETSRKYDLEFLTYDWDRLGKDDLIGSATVDISKLTAGKEENMTLALKHGSKNCGKLMVKVLLKDWPIVERDFWTSFAKHFDYDYSNTLSVMEISAMLESIESPADEDTLHQFFSATDSNNDGELTFEEFVAAMHIEAYGESDIPNPLLKKMVPDGTTDFIWRSVATMPDDSSIGTLMIERGFYGKVDLQKKPGKLDHILVHNRETGKVEEEKIPEYIHLSLKMMYASKSGRFGLSKGHLESVLKHLTEQQGKKMDSPKSEHGIDPFIKFHNLNTEEMLDQRSSFKTFNQFFYRKLKPSARQIASPNDPNVAVSPADCRLNVFLHINSATKLWIKGHQFSVLNLLDHQESLAQEYDDGHIVIARLAPQDYHRFHSPVDCKIISRHEVKGRYYTVNPIAINNDVDVFTENKRVISILESPQFGKVVYVNIGATLVGSIIFTKKLGETMKKGEEYGYFAFGGSTVILLFKKGSIHFDEDLVANSAKPIETLVKMGMSLGIKGTGSPQQQKH